jgi:hypothetical protein
MEVMRTSSRVSHVDPNDIFRSFFQDFSRRDPFEDFMFGGIFNKQGPYMRESKKRQETQ